MCPPLRLRSIRPVALCPHCVLSDSCPPFRSPLRSLNLMKRPLPLDCFHGLQFLFQSRHVVFYGRSFRICQNLSHFLLFDFSAGPCSQSPLSVYPCKLFFSQEAQIRWPIPKFQAPFIFLSYFPWSPEFVFIGFLLSQRHCYFPNFPPFIKMPFKHLFLQAFSDIR